MTYPMHGDLSKALAAPKHKPPTGGMRSEKEKIGRRTTARHITHSETCPTGAVSCSQSSTNFTLHPRKCRSVSGGRGVQGKGWLVGWLVCVGGGSRATLPCNQPGKAEWGQRGNQRSPLLLGKGWRALLHCIVRAVYKPRAASCRPRLQGRCPRATGRLSAVAVGREKRNVLLLLLLPLQSLATCQIWAYAAVGPS